MAEPLLLTYNLDLRSDAMLRALCQSMGIRCRSVARDEYALPVGALAGIPAVAPRNAPSAPFDDPMLVMCHLSKPQLDAFLQGMRDAGVPRVALKAVLTPVNVAWSSRALRDELAREHEALRRK